MNIHEIIHAWEKSALPTDLDSLSAMESKVDDYAHAASEWEAKSNSVLIKGVYAGQLHLFFAIKNDIQIRINQAIDGEYNTRRMLKFESSKAEGGDGK